VADELARLDALEQAELLRRKELSPSELVDAAIESGRIFDSPAWRKLGDRARQSGEPMHFIGLLSDGNVHSHIDHLCALLRRCHEEEIPSVRVHVLLDGRDVPEDYEHTLLGFSTGYYAGDTLVVETTGVTANHSNAGFVHSDQLTSVERFTRSQDGDRLDLEVTFSDPVNLATPIVMARAWAWAPGEEIYPYDACETPDE